MAITQVTREANRARFAAKAAAVVTARQWALSDTLRNAAVIIYVLAGYEVEPALRFLAMAGRVRHWPSRSAEDLGRLVEDLFMEFEAGEIANLTDTNEPSDAVAMREAAKCSASGARSRPCAYRSPGWSRARQCCFKSGEDVLHALEATMGRSLRCHPRVRASVAAGSEG